MIRRFAGLSSRKTPAANPAGDMESGGDLCSRAVSSQVRSALRGLTSVFGMGTGGTLSSLPPEMVSYSVEGSGGTKLFSLSLAVRRTLTTAQQ